MDVLYACSYFQFFQSLYQSFGDCTECTDYNWYHRNFHLPLFFSFQARSGNSSLFLSSFNFTLLSAGTAKSTIRQVLCFWSRLGDSIVFQIPENFVRPFLPDGFWFTIYSHGQFKFLTVSSGSSFSPSRVYPNTLFVLICGIPLLCDWSFHLYPHITFICYFVASYLFLSWYSWFLWRCSVLLFEKIHFLS